MTPDGIDSSDWDRVHELAVQIVNADDEDKAAPTRELLALLDELDLKYGPRPSLLATRADYVSSPRLREECLHRAYVAAERLGDARNMVWIASSLAGFYIEEQPDAHHGAIWLEKLKARLLQSPDEHDAKEALRLDRLLSLRHTDSGD